MKQNSDSALAVLIDGDNASPKYISFILEEIANYGTASVKRIYGDWTKPNLNSWKECLLAHSIQPMQQFSYTSGKNATDGAMIIDAMDLLYTERFSGFCIVSSDSDFTRLAARIREQGLTVYGFGERKTPRPFITACDKFIYFDALNMQDALETSRPATNRNRKPGEPERQKSLTPENIHNLWNAVSATANEDGWANLANVGAHLAKQFPDFVPRNFGYTRLSDLVRDSGIVEIHRTEDKQPVVLVRLKT